MNLVKVLLLLVMCKLHPGLTFAPSAIRSLESKLLRSSRSSSTSLSASSSIFMNETFVPAAAAATYDDDELFTKTSSQSFPDVWSQTLAVAEIEALESMMDKTAATTVDTAAATILEEKRNHLKKQLAQKAITNFIVEDDEKHQQQPRGGGIAVVSDEEETAESIMKELEQINPLPILRPATHYSLNANWSFVFTGVPTIGMKLITLLSRISVLFPFEILDFRDVALKVTDRQTKAMAIVSVTICGAFDWELQVCTSLRRPTQKDFDGGYQKFRGEDGTLLLEHFQGIWLNGVEIPTPKKWHTTRTLEITYMDSDIMIARTSGGEPHLLLRNSPMCYTLEEMVGYEDEIIEDEIMEECNIDDEGNNKWTQFFADAIEMYGKRLTRCLVDREFGKEEYDAKRKSQE